MPRNNVPVGRCRGGFVVTLVLQQRSVTASSALRVELCSRRPGRCSPDIGAAAQPESRVRVLALLLALHPPRTSSTRLRDRNLPCTAALRSSSVQTSPLTHRPPRSAPPLASLRAMSVRHGLKSILTKRPDDIVVSGPASFSTEAARSALATERSRPAPCTSS